MYRITIIAVFIVLFSPVLSIVKAQNPRLKTGEWLCNWYLAGPFPLEKSSDRFSHLPGFGNDFLISVGGEKNPVVKDGQPIKYGSFSTKWMKYETSDSIINLSKIFSEKLCVTAYAYTEIESNNEGIYILALGSDDAGRLWFNGEQVWDFPASRRYTLDDDLILVVARKGKNKVLLKVEDWENQWKFGARFLPFNLNEFLATQSIFQVTVDSTGIPKLQFLLRESLAKELFKSVQLEIVNTTTKTTLWKGNWSMKKNFILPVGSDEYTKNSLKITATLMDDNLWGKEIPFASGKSVYHTLFENKETDYVIIIGNDASESEKWSAKELQHWLMEVSGVLFPIKSDDEEMTNHELIIGWNKHLLANLGLWTKKPADNDESYHYKNVGSTILLWGGKERGSMYAVFSFLEKEFGCRWYTPSVSIIPTKTKYAFNFLNSTQSPSLLVRNDFYYEAFDPNWAARNKMNGAMSFREQHGGVEGYWSVHTFATFLPPSEFFDTHPEYYSLIDGKRVSTLSQPCLTNPDVLDIVTERLKETMRKFPEYLIYSVSQNDWENPCQCENCRAIADKEKSEAGPVIWFVNQVAERIKAEFPHKYVGTLAYQYSRKPPATIKPLENVVVRLCSIECCFAHDFKSCPNNKEFLADLEGWAAIAPKIYIWDYVVNFDHYLLPYPNFNVLQSNIKAFHDNNAIGIMEQGAYQSRGGEFAELRAYLISKLLWDSEVDVNLVINDFMSGYYGRSGQFVSLYLDLLQSQITANTHINIRLSPDDILFSDKFIREAEKIFDLAEQVADNDEILHRIEMARLPVMYLKCKRTPIEALYDGTYDRFNQIVKREKITHFAEAGKPQVDGFHRQVKSAK